MSADLKEDSLKETGRCAYRSIVEMVAALEVDYDRYTELRELSSGGGRGGLNLKLLGSLEIPLPSIPEQAAIASVLSDMDAEISALEARRNKTRALKQGMMQELLTGITRLI
jgi:type I restriction enzyme S subunit